MSDFAEEMFYAKNHRLPDPKGLRVQAHEPANSPVDTPVYEIEIALGTNNPVLRTELKVNGPIWSPEVYKDLAAALARDIGSDSILTTNKASSTALLQLLTDGSAATIEQENWRISGVLEKDFSNPGLHEQAAVLLGAFTLREHSGHFFDIRSLLCRITAHLVMAHQLLGEKPLGINGQITEVMLLTLMNNQVSALDKLNSIKEGDSAVMKWRRALQAFNTSDYRPLAEIKNLSEIERIARFQAFSKSTENATKAWENLSDKEKAASDFIRIANGVNHSVENGHELLAVSIPAELKEVAIVYEMSHGQRLHREQLASALNATPERCLSVANNGVQVRVIGWGQWAMFFQRHLGHAINENFSFMNEQWGVPDDAKEFSAKCDQMFGELRLYPFVQILVGSVPRTSKSAQENSLKIIVTTPHLVPSECWEQFCYALSREEENKANKHAYAWFKHSPPPGTVYDLFLRLSFEDLITMHKPGAINRIIKFREMAPYGTFIPVYLMHNEYHDHPTYEQVEEMVGPMLPYSTEAVDILADMVKDQPDRYEKLMSSEAEVDPSYYFTLGNYFRSRNQDEKAVVYFEKGYKLSTDRVWAAAYAGWLAQYYLKKGETNKAQTVVDEAGEVYSAAGLRAKAEFLEATGKYDEAFEWYAKIEERYGDSGPLVAFCTRYKTKTGDQHFDSELQTWLTTKLFTNGMEHTSLKDFQSAPADGVLIRQENDLVRQAGLKIGSVIVAFDGIRVHNFEQYSYVREASKTPEMNLIVWQDSHYLEVKASPPDHRFGAPFGDYSAANTSFKLETGRDVQKNSVAHTTNITPQGVITPKEYHLPIIKNKP